MEQDQSLIGASQALVSYIRAQEKIWGSVGTVWGTILVLPEHCLNPLVRAVEKALAQEGLATSIKVSASDPNPVPLKEAVQETKPPARPAPTYVSAGTSMGGKSGMGV